MSVAPRRERVKQAPHTRADARGLCVAVLRAAFNAPVVEGLAAGARSAFLELGGRAQDLEELEVPGAFELPQAAHAAALSGRFDALVALGAVIRGETDHYEHVARETSNGLMTVARETLVPLGFGVLTVTRAAHALARSAEGPHNKGAEALRAAVAMVHVLRALASRSHDRSPNHSPNRSIEASRSARKTREAIPASSTRSARSARAKRPGKRGAQ